MLDLKGIVAPQVKNIMQLFGQVGERVRVSFHVGDSYNPETGKQKNDVYNIDTEALLVHRQRRDAVDWQVGDMNAYINNNAVVSDTIPEHLHGGKVSDLMRAGTDILYIAAGPDNDVDAATRGYEPWQVLSWQVDPTESLVTVQVRRKK